MIKKELDNYQKLLKYNNLIEEELLKVLTGAIYILKNLDTEGSKEAFDEVNKLLKNNEIIKKRFFGKYRTIFYRSYG